MPDFRFSPKVCPIQSLESQQGSGGWGRRAEIEGGVFVQVHKCESLGHCPCVPCPGFCSPGPQPGPRWHQVSSMRSPLQGKQRVLACGLQRTALTLICSFQPQPGLCSDQEEKGKSYVVLSPEKGREEGSKREGGALCPLYPASVGVGTRERCK